MSQDPNELQNPPLANLETAEPQDPAPDHLLDPALDSKDPAMDPAMDPGLAAELEEAGLTLDEEGVLRPLDGEWDDDADYDEEEAVRAYWEERDLAEAQGAEEADPAELDAAEVHPGMLALLWTLAQGAPTLPTTPTTPTDEEADPQERAPTAGSQTRRAKRGLPAKPVAKRSLPVNPVAVRRLSARLILSRALALIGDPAPLRSLRGEWAADGLIPDDEAYGLARELIQNLEQVQRLNRHGVTPRDWGLLQGADDAADRAEQEAHQRAEEAARVRREREEAEQKRMVDLLSRFFGGADAQALAQVQAAIQMPEGEDQRVRRPWSPVPRPRVGQSKAEEAWAALTDEQRAAFASMQNSASTMRRSAAPTFHNRMGEAARVTMMRGPLSGVQQVEGAAPLTAFREGVPSLRTHLVVESGPTGLVATESGPRREDREG